MLVKKKMMHIHSRVLLQDATGNYKYSFNIFNPFHIRVPPEFENCPTTVSSHLRSGPQAAYAAEGCQPVLPGPTQGFRMIRTWIYLDLPSLSIWPRSISCCWMLEELVPPGRGLYIATQNHLTIQSVGEVSILFQFSPADPHRSTMCPKKM